MEQAIAQPQEPPSTALLDSIIDMLERRLDELEADLKVVRGLRAGMMNDESTNQAGI